MPDGTTSFYFRTSAALLYASAERDRAELSATLASLRVIKPSTAPKRSTGFCARSLPVFAPATNKSNLNEPAESDWRHPTGVNSMCSSVSPRSRKVGS